MPRKPKSSASSSASQRKTISKKRNQTNASSEQRREPVRTLVEEGRPPVVPTSKNEVSAASKSEAQVSALSKIENEVRTVPKSEEDASTSSSSVSKEQESAIHVLAKFWRQGLAGLATIIEGLIVSTLMGFTPWPTSSPLALFIGQRPILALIVGGTLIVVTFVSVLILLQSKPNVGGKNWYGIHWLISTAMPIIGYVLFAALLSIVLIRPTWCPTLFCPAPQLVPITNPKGVNDNNLEIYLTAIQSESYVIPGNPASYSLSNLPTSISAVRSGGQTPYRVVLGVHSLQQGRYGIIIEEVALLVKQVPLMPYPLNVWTNSLGLDYHSNPYRVIYRGQAVGTTLAATYMPMPNAHVQLAPGEADELDIQVVSATIADLQFQVQVTYRVSNESQLHTLTLRNVFEVVFSDASNWHSYHLRNGHLTSDL